MVWKVQKSFELLLIIFSIMTVVPLPINHNEKFLTRTGTTDVQDNIKLRYTWTIKNLKISNYATGEELNSPMFSANPNDECPWYLSLYPKGNNAKYKEYVSIYINSESCNVSANVYFGFINANNEEINRKDIFYNFPKNHNWGYYEFIKQDFLMDENNSLFVNDSLTIFCEIKNSTLLTSNDLSGKCNQLSQNDDVGKDFAFLLENEDFSDVILSAGGKDFPALRAILSARSPIFKALFEHDNEEIKISRVDIADVSDDVVKEMLRYIYTGEVPNLDDLDQNLLPAAEKYELVGLKTRCEKSISAKLTVDNAVEFYVLGDTYSAGYLKGQANDFIVAHASDVVPTTGFKSFIQTHPLLVDEIAENILLDAAAINV